MMGAAAMEGYTIVLYIHVCRSMHDDDEQDKPKRKRKVKGLLLSLSHSK